MLKVHILNHLDNKQMGQKKLAQIVGVSESTISRFLNDRDELKFETVLKLIKELFPDKEKEYMAEYAPTQKSMNARFCMEYCMIYRLWDITEGLVQNLYDSSNPTDREWAKIYDLELMRVKGELNKDELLHALKKYFPNTVEVQILHTFITAYIYYEMNKQNLTFELLDGLEQQINSIKSLFMRDCLNIRLGMLMNVVYLYQNEVDKAREYSMKVIEQDVIPHVKAIAYDNLGQSYLFEDYEKAKEHLDRAKLMYLQTGKEEYARTSERTLSFIESYWRIDREFTLELSEDPITQANYAYYLLQRGDLDGAKKLLNELKEDIFSEWDKPFYYYYKGLVEQDKLFFYHSVKGFKSVENAFHLQLPLQELEKLGEEKVLLEIFSYKGG
ncbi:AimR family lysis-lysogeny pheromone receptor [Bacillus horti]|uniref:Transcriptional regulator with XRE-family HTH domain n=1 Tax=Caldalkalibacillus horti TaxID=77523 RepID=A0ABT9VZY1_9BACI|nr:AimR family lysis-lysogeny pheromone receptor [Bacillus horti]MDQ0166415.1 transcriptional regulator with XRE-family HTH domain [Bacillus horti]